MFGVGVGGSYSIGDSLAKTALNSACARSVRSSVIVLKRSRSLE